MSILRALLARVRSFRRSARADRDLDDELRAYVEARAVSYETRGLTPAEAERAALIEVGGIEQVKEGVRDVRVGAALGAAYAMSDMALESSGDPPVTRWSSP